MSEYTRELEAARAEGAANERKRISAIFAIARDASAGSLASRFACLEEAVRDVESGTSVDASFFRKWAGIARNETDSNKRQQDSDAMSAALDSGHFSDAPAALPVEGVAVQHLTGGMR